VEDFKVFTVFMEDMNIILNDQSQNKVEEEIKKMKEQQRLMKEEALKHMQKAAQTPRHELELAIQMSLKEEEERRKREQSLEAEEEEALRIAMEQSLQFSKQFN
jgi:Flp pilus assembly protein TadB